MSWLSLAVQQHLSETTAHGLSRLVGTRTLGLRLFWAASFVALCVVCCVSLQQSLLRLQRQDQKTAFYAENVPFEFPDLFVCGLAPISASFSLNITEEESSKLRAAIAAVQRQANNTHWQNDLHTVMHSLPYQLLADTLGHRVNQMIFLSEFSGEGTLLQDGGKRRLANVSEFYHANHLRCARAAFTEAERRLLRQAGNGLKLFMLADAMTSDFPIGKHAVYQQQMGGLRAYPPHWDFVEGWNVFGDTGLRMFFVEPNTFPADWSTAVLLNTGSLTDVRVSMVATEYAEADFPNDCVPKSQAARVQFENPYSSTEPYTFKYTFAYCYYSELAQRTEALLNCTPYRHPKPASYSHLRSCYNLTGISMETFRGNQQRKKELRAKYNAIVESVSRLCSSRHPCSSKSYSVQATSVSWPPEGGVANFMTALRDFLLPYLQQPLPLLNFAVSFAFDSNRVVTDPNEVRRMLHTQVVQVRLFAEGEYSTKVAVSLDYTVMNFFAEAGGFLGLYLGCSVLTLGELLELLHNVIAAVACGDAKCRRRETKVADTKMPQDAEPQVADA